VENPGYRIEGFCGIRGSESWKERIGEGEVMGLEIMERAIVLGVFLVSRLE
jgi:hypothetical protein